MKYRMLAIDVDETLTHESTNEISPKVHDALRSIWDRVHVTIVTARARTGFLRIIEELGLPPEYHVYENGAKIIDPKGKILRDLHIPHEEVQQILDLTSGYFDEVGFCIDDHWLDQQGVDTTSGVNGLSFTAKNVQNGELIKKLVKSMPNRYAVYTGRHWLHPQWAGVLIFHRQATKGAGMYFIQEKLGITDAETIAVGDGMTDISMFEHAGVKVAMGNAEDAVKAAANYIAPSVSKDGLAEVIKRFFIDSGSRPE